MIVTVEKEIPYNPELPHRCMGDSDFEGVEVCRYHVERNRYHGNKAPAEIRRPKCTLFDEWLSGRYIRCKACKKACKKALETSKAENGEECEAPVQSGGVDNG